jgi:hypothetical protein
MTDLNLSKAKYQKLRNDAIKHKANLYPAYNHLRDAKESCYPDGIEVSENGISAELPLRELLYHTSHRILQLDSVREKIGSLDLLDTQLYLVLYCKWGFDGSSGQSRYKQKFGDEYDESLSDKNLFSTGLVTLKLSFELKTIWEIDKPSSTRYCRPIRLQYTKETMEVLQDEKTHR